MGTVIRPELSDRNKWKISKHRYYELKHFCLQYNEWKQLYSGRSLIQNPKISRVSFSGKHPDFVGEEAVRRVLVGHKIELVEQAAHDTDPELAGYILLSVTEGMPWTELEMMEEIPCSRGTFYDRYRKFFWILDQRRE